MKRSPTHALLPLFVALLLYSLITKTSALSSIALTSSCDTLSGTTRALVPRMTGTDVLSLQRLLNLDKDTLVNKVGLGSPNNETKKYGEGTYFAVKRFQEKYLLDYLLRNNMNQGTGFAGTQTKTKLYSLYCMKTFSGQNTAQPSPLAQVTVPIKNTTPVPSENIPSPILQNSPLPYSPTTTPQQVREPTPVTPPVVTTPKIPQPSPLPPTPTTPPSPIPGTYFATFTGKAYYVDAENGSDTESGSQTKPWKTLARARSAILLPGDALLLNCSSVWREPFQLSASSFAPKGNIIVAGYGTCTNTKYPTIKGSDVITGPWTRDASNQNIYTTTAPQNVQQVFLNGKKLTRARHPNYGGIGSEFHITKSVPNLNSFTVSSEDMFLLQNKDTVGATAYIRVVPWFIDTKTVESYDATLGKIALTSPVTYPTEAGSGYTLEGKKWMLDSPGEWYFDATTKILSVWPPNGEQLQGALVEASVRNDTFNPKQFTDSRFEHLAFEQSSGGGIYIQSPTNVTITDITGRNDKSYNIVIENAKNTTLKDSIFSGAAQTGIRTQGTNSNLSILHNSISQIGLSGDPSWSCCGISLTAKNSLVENNTITNVAYHGISFTNLENTIIRHNNIENFCMRLSDCAGIYTYNGAEQNSPTVNTIIEKNILVSAPGNPEGEVGGGAKYAAGVYLDNHTNHVSVLGNMISNTTVGIMLNEARDTIISDNKIWKTPLSALRAGGQPNNLLRNKIFNNTFFGEEFFTDTGDGTPKEVTHFAEFWGPGVPESVNFGANGNKLDHNTILTHNENTARIFGYALPSITKAYTKTLWNNLGNTDLLVNPLITKNILLNYSGPSLIQGGEISASGTPWKTYFVKPGTGSISFGNFTGCNETCAKFVAGSGGDLFISNQFNLNLLSKTLYYIEATILSNGGDTGGSAIVRRTVAPYETFGYNKYFPDTATGEPFVLRGFFRATSAENARLDLYGKIGKETFFDDIHLFPVSSYTLFNPYNYSAHLINATDQVKAFSCSDTKMLSCSASDDQGNPVSWPIMVSPWTSKIIVSSDTTWKK